MTREQELKEFAARFRALVGSIMPAGQGTEVIGATGVYVGIGLAIQHPGYARALWGLLEEWAGDNPDFNLGLFVELLPLPSPELTE